MGVTEVPKISHTKAANKTSKTHKAATNTACTTTVPVGQQKDQQVKTPKENPVAVTYKEDIIDGILVKKDKSFFGGKEHMVFDDAKFEEKYHKKLTYGEIKKRYDLSDGNLQKANGLRLMASGPLGPDERGRDLNKYYPGEVLGNLVGDIKIGMDDNVKKHINEAKK